MRFTDITKTSPADPPLVPLSRTRWEKCILRNNLLRSLLGAHGLALADQAVVSGASFITTVMVGRYTDSSQLGLYAIAVSLLASSLAVQRSLVTLPYSIQRHYPLGTRAEYAGSLLTHSNLLSVLIVVVLGLGAFGLFIGDAQRELILIIWALAAVMPFAFLREFSRRFAFAHLKVADALILDIVVACLQLSSLGWLGWTGHMSAVTACGAIGLASGLPAIGWMYFTREGFVIRTDQLKAAMKQSWRLGKWLFAGQVAVQVQLYSIYWLSALIGGAAVTGVYAASMSIVSFANPLLFGVGNILSARSAVSWNNGGAVALRRQVIQDAILIVMLMTPFCVLVFFLGEEAIHLLYHGSEYQGQGGLVTVLALATLVASLSMPPSNALASIERPDAAVIAGAIGAALTGLLVWYLMQHWGLQGAAFGLLIGSSVATISRWLAFLILVPQRGETERVIRVVEEFVPSLDLNCLTITHQGEGDHANVYLIESKEGVPIWQTSSSLIVKLYKSDVALTIDMVRQQFEALVRLRSTLEGVVINGWRISTPQPLYLCKSPLALVMTRVSGQDLLSATAARESLTLDALHNVADILASVIKRSGAQGQIHGDLGLQNIYFDISTKTLAFIDPGTLESCGVCNAEPKRWRPVILDLGHMLCDAATDVKAMITNPAGHSRRRILTEMTLCKFIGTIEPSKEKQKVLAKILACAQTHLAETVSVSWSIRGVWRWVVKQIAIRKVISIVRRVCTEPANITNANIALYVGSSADPSR